MRNATQKHARLLMAISFVLAAIIVAGCSRTGDFPHSSGTQVDLSKNNYRVVKANAIGQSSGFKLLGILPLAAPRYTSAISDMYESAGMQEGTAQALVNVTQERSSLYLILFSIPTLTVRADIIEFTE